jgi:hypothetical protein
MKRSFGKDHAVAAANVKMVRRLLGKAASK